jgi:hypothetical protein
MSDGVEVIYVDEATLLGRRDEVEHELAQIRSMRTERECLDELRNIAFLLREDDAEKTTSSAEDRRERDNGLTPPQPGVTHP